MIVSSCENNSIMSFSVERGKKDYLVSPLSWLIKIGALLLIIEKIFFSVKQFINADVK